MLEIFPLPGILIVNVQIIPIIAQLAEAEDVQSQKQTPKINSNDGLQLIDKKQNTRKSSKGNRKKGSAEHGHKTKLQLTPLRGANLEDC